MAPTKQETFNKVAEHLITQWAKAEGEYGFAYHAPDGKKCAVGCLIPDEIYDPDLEGQLAYDFPDTLIEAIAPDGDRDMLRDLQQVHDNVPVFGWPAELKGISARFDLDDSIVDATMRHLRRA